MTGGSGEILYLRDRFGSTGVCELLAIDASRQDYQFRRCGFSAGGWNGRVLCEPHLRTPYVLQFNLSWQQQLSNSFTSEIDYVGSSSHKLTGIVDANPMLPGSQIRKLNAVRGLNENSDFGALTTFESVGQGALRQPADELEEAAIERLYSR